MKQSKKLSFKLEISSFLYFSLDGTVTTTFEPTPVMSSYLLAFVVSDFDYVSNELTKRPEDTLHRIWVRPDSVSKAPYALENSAKVLKTLENYVGFEFALPKVDSAAIPNKGEYFMNYFMIVL
jgi:aminopeptidase N